MKENGIKYKVIVHGEPYSNVEIIYSQKDLDNLKQSGFFDFNRGLSIINLDEESTLYLNHKFISLIQVIKIKD